MLFFKQKTAYERRISDWSADVCASDLLAARQGEKGRRPSRRHRPHRERCAPRRRIGDPIRQQRRRARQQERGADRHPHLWPCRARTARARLYEDHQPGAGGALTRSEEHTSELQSLMRISYAVFCLKKKKTKTWKIQVT